jgi:hypothetical protein
MLTALVLCASSARAGEFDNALETPDSFGDQVIYYYDARPDFTTFLALRNGSDADLTINVQFYGGSTFGTPVTRVVTLAGGRSTVIDAGSLRSEGLPALPGMAIATAVNELGQGIVTAALTGNFTVANLLTGSAFGAAAAARSAVNGAGNVLDIGAVIGVDGTLQRLRPSSALLAAYYDPATLAPVSASGNQLIFINFQDTYDPAIAPTYSAVTGTTNWSLRATTSNGLVFPETTFTASGVTVTDLASVLGAGVNGSGGGISFFADAGSSQPNRLIYFAEALGTFGTGYLLPPIRLLPRAN